jgi:hypothetical protein
MNKYDKYYYKKYSKYKKKYLNIKKMIGGNVGPTCQLSPIPLIRTQSFIGSSSEIHRESPQQSTIDDDEDDDDDSEEEITISFTTPPNNLLQRQVSFRDSSEDEDMDERDVDNGEDTDVSPPTGEENEDPGTRTYQPTEIQPQQSQTVQSQEPDKFKEAFEILKKVR